MLPGALYQAFPPCEARRVLQQRREGRRARALRDGLLDLDQRDHGALDGFFFHDENFRDERFDYCEGQLADVLDRDAFGDGVAADVYGEVVEPLIHGGVGLRLRSINFYVFAQTFRRGGHA